MIVPATFPFPDERCQELAARRGLILNMHHCLVLGVNMYRWPEEVPFSFRKHPEIPERYWQTSIDAYKNREVVWSVGYRGKSDHPFWVDDPELKTPSDRGGEITRAIARQVQMVRKSHPDAPIIANMWSEGADLFHQGLIKLPDGVTLVWPDGGNGITFLDLAGLPAHPGMHGVSFKPLALGNKPADWRKSFLCYYSKDLGPTPTCRGIRTENAKLIVYKDKPEWTSVYDLQNDPHELNSLPADGPLAKQLSAELEKQMKAVGFTQ